MYSSPTKWSWSVAVLYSTLISVTNSKEFADKETETLLTNVELSPDIEYDISVFCKVLLKQLGQNQLENISSQLRLFMYKQGSDEEEVAMHDFYTDYAAALATLDYDEEDAHSDMEQDHEQDLS